MPANLNPMPGTESAANAEAAAAAANAVALGNSAALAPGAHPVKPVSSLQATIITILLVLLLAVSAANLILTATTPSPQVTFGGNGDFAGQRMEGGPSFSSNGTAPSGAAPDSAGGGATSAPTSGSTSSSDA